MYSLLIVGIIVAILGMVFHMQGQGVVGPTQSFMYENPDWMMYGFALSLIGQGTAVAATVRILQRRGRRV